MMIVEIVCVILGVGTASYFFMAPKIANLVFDVEKLKEKMAEIEESRRAIQDADHCILMPKTLWGKPLEIEIGPDSRWVRIKIKTPDFVVSVNNQGNVVGRGKN